MEKPSSILTKPIKADFAQFMKALGKAGVDTVFGKWDSLGGHAVDALAALGVSATAGEVAWLLVYRALLEAMKELLSEIPETSLEKLDSKSLQESLEKALAEHKLEVDAEFFKNPANNDVVQKASRTFCDWLIGLGTEESDATAIARRLPLYFATALHDEWGARSKVYALLEEKRDTPFAAASLKERSWARYRNWLQKQIDRPLFFEAFSLRQVFVPLRAYYQRPLEVARREDLGEATIREGREQDRVAFYLEKELLSWLDKADRDDAIRLISGGPGSGKSSFAKVFAATIAQKAELPVLFIPLHHFEPSDDLVEAVGKFVRADGFLPFNPLDSEHRDGRLLIVFDGLDELAMQGKIAEKTARDFVLEVQRKLDRFNQVKTHVQVLISGRELVVQANEASFRRRGQILHVLPYVVSSEEIRRYVDKDKVLGADQRSTWWKKYGEASGLPYKGLPVELKAKALVDITSQPLLNYLVSISLKRGKLNLDVDDVNLNALYADLLTAIYERGWAGHQHVAIQGIEEKDFIRVLEEIALAAWHGDGRSTTVKEIERHCKDSGLNPLLSRFQIGMQEDANAKVTQLLAAFYFRQSGQDSAGERTFEFTHKSFGEYLAARRVLREMQLIHRKLEERKRGPDDGWDERDALHRWVLVCGPAPIDVYLHQFVRNEIHFVSSQENELAAKLHQTFWQLIQFVLKNGMPMERLGPRPSFWEENRQALNSEEALLIGMNACARLTKTVLRLVDAQPENLSSWLGRIRGQRLGYNHEPRSIACLEYLDLRNCQLLTSDFYSGSMAGSDFTQANLVESDGRFSNFSGANLRECTLAYGDFSGAVFDDVNLQSASLSGSVFEEASLRRANLEGAQFADEQYWVDDREDRELRDGFVGSELSGADFTAANLRGAVLMCSSMRYVDLTDANLEGANLQWVDLTGANLQGANLRNADLRGSKLVGVDLAGATMDGAILEGEPDAGAGSDFAFPDEDE